MVTARNAIGTAFCWLLLRGRMIPSPLAWLGVIASVLLMLYWLWRIRVEKTFLGIVSVGTPQVSGATK